MIRFSTKRLPLGSSCFSLSKIALLCALTATQVKAQTADPAITSDVAAQLNARITDLERKANRVDELEAEIKALKANVAAAQTPVPPDVPDQFPKVQMNILSDVTFHYGSDRNDPNTFANGDVDAVVTAKLSDQASVLGDFVVSSNQGSFAFEIERFLLQYRSTKEIVGEQGKSDLEPVTTRLPFESRERPLWLSKAGNVFFNWAENISGFSFFCNRTDRTGPG